MSYRGPKIFRRKQTTINIGHGYLRDGLLILIEPTRKRLRKIGRRRFKVDFKREYFGICGKPKHTRKAPHKYCPICGKARQAGYFESCRDCRHLVEVRENVTRIIMQLGSIAQDKGYRLSYDFCGADIIIRARTIKAVQAVDGFGEPIPKGKCYTTEANARMSLRDLYVSRQDLKHVVMCAVLELFEHLERKIQETIDSNGRVVEVAGMIVPPAGTWNLKEPYRRR